MKGPLPCNKMEYYIHMSVIILSNRIITALVTNKWVHLDTVNKQLETKEIKKKIVCKTI